MSDVQIRQLDSGCRVTVNGKAREYSWGEIDSFRARVLSGDFFVPLNEYSSALLIYISKTVPRPPAPEVAPVVVEDAPGTPPRIARRFTL